MMRLLWFLVLWIFSFSIIVLCHVGIGWHDQQRLYQLLLISSAAIVLLFKSSGVKRFPSPAFLIIVAIFALGLGSSIMAEYPLWALREWGRYVGLLILCLCVTGLVAKYPWQKLVLYVLALAAFFSAFQFLVFYLMAFLTGIQMLNIDILFNGFSNPRFLNQFQVLLIPVMGWLVLYHWQNPGRYSQLLVGVLFSVLAVHWCLMLCLGGRGAWLAVVLAHVWLLLVAKRFWPLACIQLLAVTAGALLFALLFYAIPYWLDLEPLLRDGLRAGLSKREVIWSMSWEMFLANPWLGIGPMHFAAEINSIAAHPHQVILQWLAEWGVFATLLVMGVGLWGLWGMVQFLRSDRAEHLDAALFLSISGALLLAQVDGVFVMPYAETWLAILLGLVLARFPQAHETSAWQINTWRLLSVPVLVILVHVLVVDVPRLPQDSEAFMEQHKTGWTPRFWLQGWIPMKQEE